MIFKVIDYKDYKEKYNEALDRAKAIIAGETNTSDALFYLDDIKRIFPELKENEDERIRKEIVRFIQMEVENEIVGNKMNTEERQEILEEVLDDVEDFFYDYCGEDGYDSFQARVRDM